MIRSPLKPFLQGSDNLHALPKHENGSGGEEEEEAASLVLAAGPSSPKKSKVASATNHRYKYGPLLKSRLFLEKDPLGEEVYAFAKQIIQDLSL